jgi:Flp pilus assembly pilin Flp
MVRGPPAAQPGGLRAPTSQPHVRGQTSAEYAGVLVVIAAVMLALGTSNVGDRISGTMSDIVCRIAGQSCHERSQIQTAAAGPSLAGGDIAILPFPGSVSVTCGAGPGGDEACKAPSEPNLRVQGSGSVTVERSQTKLDGQGCPTQTASVATAFKLEGVGAKSRDDQDGTRPKLGGKLSGYFGHQTKYAVTASPGQMDAMERGDREPPNPLDPRTIAPGESVQMSEEFYKGVGASGDYRALQVSLGYDEGKRVSSGARRIDADTVRVYVGDEDFVRHALTVGLGGSSAKVEAGVSQEISDGKLRAVDIDISTQAGWDAYQGFVTSGRVPDGRAAGTANPTTSTTRKLSKSVTLGGTFGDLKFGGLLSDAEGNHVETKHADGSVERNLSIRYRDVGLEVGARGDARTYALNLEGVRPDVFANFQQLNRGDTRRPQDGNVRMDFTGDDLMGMRRQALGQIAAEIEQRGVHPRPSAADVADNLARNHGVIKVNGVEYTPEGAASVLANARSPEEVLEGLYRLANGNPNDFLTGPMTDFILRTNAANGDANPTPRGRLPGSVHGPACA